MLSFAGCELLFETSSNGQPHIDSNFYQNGFSGHSPIGPSGCEPVEGEEHEVYEDVLALSTEPLHLDKPVVPCLLQRTHGCPYVFIWVYPHNSDSLGFLFSDYWE